MKLLDIARAVGGELVGDGSLEIRGVAGIREADEGELTFLANSRYADWVGSTRATAILLARDGVAPPAGKAIIFCANPYLAFLQAIRYFAPDDRFAPGIDPTAVVAPDVTAGAGCSVGARCVIEGGVVLGAMVPSRTGRIARFRGDTCPPANASPRAPCPRSLLEQRIGSAPGDFASGPCRP